MAKDGLGPLRRLNCNRLLKWLACREERSFFKLGITVCLFIPIVAVFSFASDLKEETSKIEVSQVSSDPQIDQTFPDQDDFLAAIGPMRLTWIRRVIPDIEVQCLPPDHTRTGRETTAQKELLELFSRVSHSSLGKELLNLAALRSTLVCLDSQTGFQGYFRSQMRLIGLNGRNGQAKRLAFFVHELAHVPQHPNFSNNRNFAPQDMIRIHRFREAAAEAMATAILAELREAGDAEAWNVKLTTKYHDILRAYDRTIAIAGNGETGKSRAMKAAFSQWFRGSWRRHYYDEMMLDHLERIAEDHHGIMPAHLRADDRYLAGIGRLPDGQNYLNPATFDSQADPYGLDLPADHAARLKRIRLFRFFRLLDGPIP